MSEQNIERVPGFQKWLGKKALSLHNVNEYSGGGVQLIGKPVLVVEAKELLNLAGAELSEMQWRIIEVFDSSLMVDFYQRGIYKVVGVGLVFDYDVPSNRYKVLVNDTIRDTYDDSIPF